MNSHEESDFLFREHPLLFVPEIKVKVWLPKSEKLSKSQIQLLNQLVLALKYRHEEIQWFYYPEQETELDLSFSALHQDEICLFFRRIEDSSEDPDVVKKEKVDVITLPNLQKIEGNLQLKRRVWEVLKPFVKA